MEAERRTWVVDRQRAQRLLKSLHRDDTDRPRVLPRDAEVVPARHKEHVHMRVARADRFLLGGADLADAAVRDVLILTWWTTPFRRKSSGTMSPTLWREMMSWSSMIERTRRPSARMMMSPGLRTPTACVPPYTSCTRMPSSRMRT